MIYTEPMGYNAIFSDSHGDGGGDFLHDVWCGSNAYGCGYESGSDSITVPEWML